jgi:hypothetical protein
VLSYKKYKEMKMKEEERKINNEQTYEDDEVTKVKVGKKSKNVKA